MRIQIQGNILSRRNLDSAPADVTNNFRRIGFVNSSNLEIPVYIPEQRDGISRFRCIQSFSDCRIFLPVDACLVLTVESDVLLRFQLPLQLLLICCLAAGQCVRRHEHNRHHDGQRYDQQLPPAETPFIFSFHELSRMMIPEAEPSFSFPSHPAATYTIDTSNVYHFHYSTFQGKYYIYSEWFQT